MLLQYKRVLSIEQKYKSKHTHSVKSACIQIFSDPYFTRNLSEYREMWTISPYTARMQEDKGLVLTAASNKFMVFIKKIFF